MDINIYPFSSDCLDDIMEISTLSFPVYWSKASFQSELENKLAHYFVAKDGEKVIGYGGMWIIIDEGHITNIAVHPDYRKKGIGDLILNTMINECTKRKVIAMTLEVRASNIAAQGLYSKHGFIEEGIRKKYYEDNGEDAIIMWKHWY